MKHHATLEIWKMRDGKVYARHLQPYSDRFSFYQLTPLQTGGYILSPIAGKRADRLESEFQAKKAESLNAGLFADPLDQNARSKG